MGLIKYFLKKMKFSSSCMYNIEDEMYDRNKMNMPISQFELKYKDVKKIMKILNKRDSIFPVQRHSEI